MKNMMGDVDAVEHDPALVSSGVPADEVEQCRLSRPVRAQEPDNLTGANPQVDAIDRKDAAETSGQPDGLQQRRLAAVAAIWRRPTVSGDRHAWLGPFGGSCGRR